MKPLLSNDTTFLNLTSVMFLISLEMMNKTTTHAVISGLSFNGKCTLKRNSIPLISGCSVSNDQKQYLPSVLKSRGPQLGSVTRSDGESCRRTAGNDHGLFLQMQFCFDVEVHFNRLLWSQVWLALTADWHPLSLSVLAHKIRPEQSISPQWINTLSCACV